MIALVLAMVWTRRGQSVTLALLALLAVAAAVASPAYLAAADRAVAAGQIATAVPTERGVALSARQNEREDSGLPDFNDVGAALVSLPGFTYRYSVEFPTIGIERTTANASRFVFRQEICAHVRIRTGRCLIGEGEVIIGVATANRLGIAAGDPVTLTYARFAADPGRQSWIADGLPKQLYVAGTYEPVDPDGSYWGTHGYFTTYPGGPGEPVFANAVTLGAVDHGNTQVSIDGIAGPQALDIDNIGRLRDGLAALTATANKLSSSIKIDTGMPALLDRIDEGRSASRLIVPVLAVPLVLLACFCIFLAVGYGTEGRQPELAVVALRGARWWTRWWLATGENLIAVLAGAVAGCLAGQLLVDAVAAARFPGVGVAAGVSSLRYAPFAAGAAVLAAVLAQRRQLFSPVATLLRRNAGPANGRRGLGGPGGLGGLGTEAVTVMLAVLCCVQLIVSDGSLTGLGLLAPAFLTLGLSLLAARALLPLVTRYARRQLDAGRLGTALAALQLSRRPGGRRLFALLVATVAIAGYAAAAIDVAAQGRVVESELGVGAARVLTVEPVFRSQLIAAVRAIDPGKQFAMAVVRMPSQSAIEPLGLAADTERLAAVASWPDGAPEPAAVAGRLHPDGDFAPIAFAGQDLTVEATGSGMKPDRILRLRLAVSSPAGLGDSIVELGNVHPGPWTYQQRVPQCEKGCRLNGIQLTTLSVVDGVTGRLLVTDLRAANPDRPALPATRLADPSRWRMPTAGTLTADPLGLRIDISADGGLPDGAWVRPNDAPLPLPAAHAGERPPADTITGLDVDPQQVTLTDELPAVPRLGMHATLVDLDYADRLVADASHATEPQIWLNDKAPADILAQVAARGLTVIDDTRSSQVHRQLDEQGPALALWFYVLAGGLSALLGAGALVLAAAVDRGRRVEDLSALRAQGLRRPTARLATLWTYPALVGIAAVIGVLVALITWAVTGWALPLAGLSPPSLPLPGWPRPLAVALTVAAVLALLTVVAAATGRDLHRRIDPRDSP